MSQFRHTSAAKGKVDARKAEYQNSQSPSGKDYYKAKTRRAAYVTITANGKTLPVINGGYEDLYSNASGRPNVSLNEVTIEEKGDFGMLRQVSATFTCYNKSAFEVYEEAFLRPDSKLEVSYGYVDGSDGATLTDYTIFKFSYQLDNNNYYVCSFTAYGPAPFAGEFNLKGALPPRWADLKFKAPGWDGEQTVASLPQYIKFVAQDNGAFANVDITAPVTRRGGKVIIADNPTAWTPDSIITRTIYGILQTIGLLSADSSKLIYCTLEYLVQIINENYMSQLEGSLAGRTYVSNSTITAGSYLDPICSSNPMQVILPEAARRDPAYGGDADVDDDEVINLGSYEAEPGDYSKILLEYSYLTSLFGKVMDEGKSVDKSESDGNKDAAPTVKIQDLFDKLFEDIAFFSGGFVQLATMEDPEDSMKINIVCKNSGDNVQETVFDPIQGDGISRSVTVLCDIPSDDAYAVANGAAGNAGGHTADAIAEKDEPDSNAERKEAAIDTIIEYRDTNLAKNGFNSEDSTALQDALTTFAECLTRDEAVNNLPADKFIWPLKLTISIDGTHGFRFGDVVNTTFMPGRYRKEGISPGFIVLAAKHKIGDQDWTTELETQCTMLNKG